MADTFKPGMPKTDMALPAGKITNVAIILTSEKGRKFLNIWVHGKKGLGMVGYWSLCFQWLLISFVESTVKNCHY